MNDDSKWKRKLPCRIYDYNFKVGESYYTPQTNYIDDRSLLRSTIEPPKSKTYAERFANTPWYGSAKGLPYDVSESALSQPLVNRRAVSASRASSIMKDREDNIPPHIRVLRHSRMVGEEVKKDEKYREKPRRYHFEEEMDYKPSIYTKELKRDLGKLTDELGKAEVRSRRSSFTLDTDTVSLPTSSSVSRFEGLPPISTKSKRSSYLESSKSEYKPPTGAVGGRTRKVSFNDSESSFELPPRGPRARKVSLDEFTYRPPKSLESLKQEDYDIKVSARELKDMRRAKESEDLSESIRKSISKTRSHNIDKEAAYKYTRQMRSSSLDPFGDDSKYSAKQRATKFNYFVYGVGGK